MPSSSRTIPGTQNQFGISHAAVRVRGQTSNRTNAGCAITPFMFNEEGYHVSDIPVSVLHELIVFQYAHDENGVEHPSAADFHHQSNTHDPVMSSLVSRDRRNSCWDQEEKVGG